VLALISAAILGPLAGWAAGGLAPALLTLDEQFGVTVPEAVNAVLNWPVLMLGLGGTQSSARSLF
jgi:hypothetical protein